MNLDEFLWWLAVIFLADLGVTLVDYFILSRIGKRYRKVERRFHWPYMLHLFKKLLNRFFNRSRLR